MKKRIFKYVAFLMTLCLSAGFFVPAATASDLTDEAVLNVISHLEAIDTLQQIQNKRGSYTVKNNHYDTGTTNAAIAEEHENARMEYEKYVAEMLAARSAAQQAYDALTSAQQAQIDADLVAKLSQDLPTVFTSDTYPVTPRSDAYTFEAVNGGLGYAYEVSNHMVSGNIPQTFVLVDTADGKTSWTPSGRYIQGESNYEVAYCCDVETGLEYTTDYKRVNLEDSGYYGKNAARHIRAILQNSYPYITMDEMKAFLIEEGMNENFVNSLTRADMISAVQMAIWTYANAEDGAKDGLGYFASINVPKNTGIYFTPLHDYTNETWEWQPGKRQRSYDARAAYRVNNLAYFLCNLEGVDAQEDQIVISDVEITRAELIPGSDDTYDIGMYVLLRNAGTKQDNLTVKVTSHHTNEDGSTSVTARSARTVHGSKSLPMSVKAKSGDTITVVVEGSQTLAKGVYFYEPEGGRDVSQSLVGVSEGKTNVRAEKSFVFNDDVGEMGLRIYKTELDSGLPLSDINFDIYKVHSSDTVTTVNTTPTEEEIALYANEEYYLDSVTTDTTGYAGITLELGTYLVVEKHNAEKILAPVAPFFISVPYEKTHTSEDGTAIVKMVNYVSVYPKNETVDPPEPPIVVPPTPDSVVGTFEIIKHDAADKSKLLEGAEFSVYRPATETDENVTTISAGGVQYAVTPMLNDDGTPLILTTDENGYAVSPELPCGTYFLLETKAPSGYNLYTEAITVYAVSDLMTDSAPIEIPNESGPILPSTGGIGTAVFHIIGGILMFCSCVLLISKKPLNTHE